METRIRTLGALHAKSFSVDLDEVETDSGGATRRLVIRHPSAVSVIPFISPDEALVVAQYRYAQGRETLEFPAGKIDPGEDPETAAARELAEETGYKAGSLKKLLAFGPAVGYSTEIIHIFTAHDLSPLDTAPDDHEITRVETMKLSRLKELILAGGIIDGTTIVSLAVYEWLAREAG